MYKIMHGHKYQKNKNKANKYNRKITTYKYEWFKK